MPDERLRRQVLEAVARGLLPSSLPPKAWGGLGNGNPCSACGRLITSEQLETEFEDDARRAYHLHMQCFATWEAVTAPWRSAEPTLPLSLDDRYSAGRDQSMFGGTQQ
jgi:hypothetical protein